MVLVRYLWDTVDWRRLHGARMKDRWSLAPQIAMRVGNHYCYRRYALYTTSAIIYRLSPAFRHPVVACNRSCQSEIRCTSIPMSAGHAFRDSVGNTYGNCQVTGQGIKQRLHIRDTKKQADACFKSAALPHNSNTIIIRRESIESTSLSTRQFVHVQCVALDAMLKVSLLRHLRST